VGKIYPEEVKKKAVQLYRLDDKTTYAEVGRDLGGISGETIRNWVRQADRDEGRRDDGPCCDETDELARLRRDNVRLEKENRILRAATACFARDQL
jgi:transposase